MSHLIKLNDITIGYEKIGLLDSINLSIERDQFWGIMGPNGSGKSTLIKTLLGLLPPVSGEMRSENVIVFGYVPQHEKFDSIFPISVCEVVSMGRYSRVPPGRKLSNADKEIVLKSIEKAGIVKLKDRTFRSLSGGEKQRTLLARAIAGEPDILVLDEPTASVDIKGEAQIMELVKKIQTESKLAVLMVSHFLNTVSEFSDHIILIDKDSDIFQAGSKSEILKRESLDNFFGLNINLN
ncbi:MAG: metal ABC transporter ATP-binding protein [Thermodesulfobacteriota bacterium]